MNIEQMKQIVEGAPEDDRNHIDSLGFYHENDAHNLSDLATIIAQAEEIEKLRKVLNIIQMEGGLGIARHRQIDRALAPPKGQDDE